MSETIDENEIVNENKEILKDNNFGVAASTHEGEEDLCLKTHVNLKKEFQNLKTIIIPRHINRSNKIKLLCDNLNLPAQILNENDKIINHNEIIIVNSFGSLTKYFKYSKSVFIGKTLLKRLENEGGQNPVEAAKLNCKIYHGPYVKNFEEIYNLLRSLNITFEINNEDELSKKLKYDFENLNTKENVSSKINILGNKILNDSIKEINRVLN